MRKRKLLSLLVIIVLVVANTGYSQSKKEFRAKLDTLMENERNDRSSNRDFSVYSQKFPKYVISKTKKFLNDPETDLHYAAIGIIAEAALNSKKLSIRQEGVFQLLNTYVYSLHHAALELKKFNKEDFSAKAKDSLRVFLLLKEKRLNIIMLVGFLDMKDQIPALKSLLKLPEAKRGMRSKQFRWKVNVVLTRLGDENATKNCIKIAKESGCDRQAMYREFPDLIYTKNKTVFDFLVSVLQDGSAQTNSANPNSKTSISCGYRIMEFFPDIVENYPLEFAIQGSSQVKADNYKDALQIARQWFIDNPNYKINTNLY